MAGVLGAAPLLPFGLSRRVPREALSAARALLRPVPSLPAESMLFRLLYIYVCVYVAVWIVCLYASLTACMQL